MPAVQREPRDAGGSSRTLAWRRNRTSILLSIVLATIRCRLASVVREQRIGSRFTGDGRMNLDDNADNIKGRLGLAGLFDSLPSEDAIANVPGTPVQCEDLPPGRADGQPSDKRQDCQIFGSAQIQWASVLAAVETAPPALPRTPRLGEIGEAFPCPVLPGAPGGSSIPMRQEPGMRCVSCTQDR